MTAAVLAKHLPADVDGPIRALLERGLWVALMLCLIWLIASGGAFWLAKYSAHPITVPLNRILRSLIASTMCTAALSFAVMYIYAIH
ncbi:hypothetical protein [Nocardia terpenica]|nr:hypothetical protein [Nocardia terpenica]